MVRPRTYDENEVLAGWVYCIGRTSGKTLWKYDTEDSPQSPVIAGNRVIVASGGMLFMLDLANGGEVWTAEVSDWITSPCVVSGLVIVGADDGTVTAYGAKSK